MADRSGLYVLEAYGLANELVRWRIARGDLGDLCRGCAGAGVIITSPCQFRETMQGEFGPRCSRETGCAECRRPCPTCGGHGMPKAPVHAEDFGDDASREVAMRAFPGLDVDQARRSDGNPSAL